MLKQSYHIGLACFCVSFIVLLFCGEYCLIMKNNQICVFLAGCIQFFFFFFLIRNKEEYINIRTDTGEIKETEEKEKNQWKDERSFLHKLNKGENSQQ